MMNRDTMFEETKRVLALIDPSAFPESCDYLESILDEEELFEDDPRAIATTLMDSDKPRAFPPAVIEYITALYQMGIEDGDHRAMNDLGAQYYGGFRGFEQSFRKAVHYYEMAAANGDWQAQENLGYCYYYGRDMEKPDYEKAFHCFALGAFDGRPVSLYKIGDMYLNGLYVRQNSKEAFLIYRRCLTLIKNGEDNFAAGPVYLRLGDMYLNGVGTEKNAEYAMTHYQAAEHYLYNMVRDGEVMYKASLRRAIEGQARARELLEAALPPEEWTHD